MTLFEHNYSADQLIYKDSDISKRSVITTVKRWFGIRIYKRIEVYKNKICDEIFVENETSVGFKTKKK